MNNEVIEVLKNIGEEFNGFEFYNFIFNPINKFIPKSDERLKASSSFKPNGIFLFQDEDKPESERHFLHRVILKDTWENDYMDFVELKHQTLCSGIAYRGNRNKLENAQTMNAMIFDLDGVTYKELSIFLRRTEVKAGAHYRAIPKPTFIVSSGGGLHLYYVFDTPVALYPNIKIQLKNLKYDMTARIWEFKETTSEENIQYHSINQMFRMVGSTNPKHNVIVRAFKTGEKVSLDYMNQYVSENNRVDITKAFSPTKTNLKEAMEKYPQWYEDVVLNKQKRKRWQIERYGHDDALYQWWLKQNHKAKAGHRYFYLMCLALYAVKCNVSKDQLKADMDHLLGILNQIPHENKFTEADVKSAMEAYSKDNFLFTIKDIEKLSSITIERNKRNYQPQTDHLEEARAIRDIRMRRKKVKWDDNNGRKKGSSTCEPKILKYLADNPGSSISDICKALNMHRHTVSKYYIRDKGAAEIKISIYLKNNPGATKAEIIKSTGLSKPTVYKYYEIIKSN